MTQLVSASWDILQVFIASLDINSPDAHHLIMYQQALISEAETLLAACRAKGFRIATAESCTGGLIAGLLTDIAGASEVFEAGFVTYSNEAKVALLDVNPALLQMHGAVSELVSLEMAEGAIAHSAADISVSVTGIAGPAGGSREKPVGLVHFGCAMRGGDTVHDQEIFSGSRYEVRMDAVRHALRMLMSRV